MEDALACIEEKFPEYFELLDKLDPERQVFSNDIEKITIIIPSNNIIKRCNALLDSKEDQVLETMRTFFILGNFYTKNDWFNSRDDLVNLRGCKVSVKNTDKNIIFDNNCEIKIMRSVKDNNFTIYTLENGVPPAGTKQRAKKKPAEKQEKSKKNSRYELYSEVYQSNDPVKSATTILSSFFEFLQHEQPEVLRAILPFMDYSPLVSFMIVFEPSKSIYFFVSDKLIDNWCATREAPLDKYFFYTALKENADAFPQSSGLKDAIQEEREILLEAMTALNLINNLDETYSDLVKYNKVGRVSQCYSDLSFRYISAACKHYNIKLMQDELRALYDNCTAGTTVYERLAMMYKYLNLLPYFNDQSTLNSMTTDDVVSNVKSFVNTTYFLYLLPQTPGQFGGVPGKYEDADPRRACVDPVAEKMAKVPASKNIVNNIRNLMQSGRKLPRDLVLLARDISQSNRDDEGED